MNPTLANPLIVEHPTNTRFKSLAQVTLGVLLLALSAQIVIPLQPIPMTLQAVAVLFLGLAFPKKQAMQAVLAYLGLGAAGLPIFNQASHGLTHLMGPTLGYLLGFLLAVTVMGTLRDVLFSRPKWLDRLVLCLIGSTCIYGCGLVWLSHLLGFTQAWQLGFMPFLLPGILKTGILSSLMQVYRAIFKA